MGNLWIDKYGDVWRYIDGNTIVRLRDSNYGGWWNGKGLERYYE